VSDSVEQSAVELFGGGARPRDTRERILHAAVDLFYEQGFHAVGLDRILAEVGVTKTTFYNHFASRDDLVLEVVALRDAWELSCFKQEVIARGEYDPKAMLLAMFDVMDAWFNAPDYRGCLFITACAEFPSPKHPVHRAAAGHYLRVESDVAGMAKAAGVADPETFARQWVVLLEGIMTYRLITAEDDAVALVRPVAEALLERALAKD
jgi:AcrR family transcriptional regulator